MRRLTAPVVVALVLASSVASAAPHRARTQKEILEAKAKKATEEEETSEREAAQRQAAMRDAIARAEEKAAAEQKEAALRDADEIDESARAVYAQGNYAFCKNPAQPLGFRQIRLCKVADEIEGCEGFAQACHALTPKSEPPPKAEWSAPAWLASLARVLLYAFVAAIVLALLFPLIAMLRRSRGKQKGAPAPTPMNHATVVAAQVVPPEDIGDAEAALRLAEDHRRRGELKKALALYLAASLSSLDRRGVLRLARHRTNGEYVRSCSDAEARGALREIVREVDAAEFGGIAPTSENVERAASRATAIVRHVAAVTTFVLLALGGVGCSGKAPIPHGADPAGNDLPVAILAKNGFHVTPLDKSLATLPIPQNDDDKAPAVLVDLEHVVIEDDTRAHLVRWVEAGGVLVLFGGTTDEWPTDFRAETNHTTARELRFPIEDKENGPTMDGARAVHGDAISSSHGEGVRETVAFIGDAPYASKRRIDKGILVVVANDDLVTNAGAMLHRNPAALVWIVRSALWDVERRAADATVSTRSELRIARDVDGVPPPSNPFSSLAAAGLGTGVWHALAASVVLFLAFGIRQARARKALPPARRAFAEHVEAMGAFYGRTKAYAHALGAYGRFVEARLHEALPRGTDATTFLASRSGVAPERVAELQARAANAKAGDVLVGDELASLEELRRIMEKALGPSVR